MNSPKDGESRVPKFSAACFAGRRREGRGGDRMASVFNRGTRAKPNWWVGWIDRSGKHRQQKVGPDRGLAVQVKAKIESDLAAKHVERRFAVDTEAPPPAPLFNAAADDWIDMRSTLGADGRPAFRAWRDDQTRLKQHLRPKFGDRHLDEITVDDVRAIIEK